MIREGEQSANKLSTIQLGDYIYNQATHKLATEQNIIALTPRENTMFCTLRKHLDELSPYSEILEALYVDPRYRPALNEAKSNIWIVAMRLKNKIKPAGYKIYTFQEEGYCLQSPSKTF